MKTLFMVRHAKSDWNDFSLSDIDRPLNDRGKEDAPRMADRLRVKDLNIDVFISSPAKRAHKTAKFFAKAYGSKKEDIIIEDSIYHASPESFEHTIEKINDKYKSAAIFSHNPGITEFVNLLTEHRVDNMPTCSVFAVRADVNNWKDFKSAKKELVIFDYPKKLIG